MSELRRGRENSVGSRVAALMLVAGMALSGCIREGYGSSIEACKKGDNTGLPAKIGSGDENDPLLVLKFAKNKDYRDGSSNDNGFAGDRLDRLGEIVCSVPSGNSTETTETVFTPSGAIARSEYIVQNVPRVR